MMQMKLLKYRHRLTDLENELIVAEGKRWEEQRREFGTDVYTLLHLKWKTNKGQRTLPNVMWQPRWEGSLGRTDPCIYAAKSLCHSPETITALSVGYTPI